MIDPCPEDAPVLVAKASDPAKWMIIGLVAAVLVYDLIAPFFGWERISQYTQRKSKENPWLAVALFVSLGALVWHLVKGGPL
jgi:succinate dehydrogenase hydrophobic anchor subunit